MIKDYFNKLYFPNIEVDAIIKAIQPELDELTVSTIDIFKNLFPIIATDSGIQMWEQLLKIAANTSTEDIEFRRQRIILRLATNVPFTERFMQWFFNNVLGEKNWDYTLEYNNYKLKIRFLIPGLNWQKEIEYFLETVLPCNIILVASEILSGPGMFFAGVVLPKDRTILITEIPAMAK